MRVNNAPQIHKFDIIYVLIFRNKVYLHIFFDPRRLLYLNQNEVLALLILEVLDGVEVSYLRNDLREHDIGARCIIGMLFHL